jgi:hypothetical protein
MVAPIYDVANGLLEMAGRPTNDHGRNWTSRSELYPEACMV